MPVAGDMMTSELGVAAGKEAFNSGIMQGTQAC